MMVLMYLNAEKMEIKQIEKVFQIVLFLITGKLGDQASILQIDVNADSEKVL